MVSALDSRESGPDSSPGQGHCVVFLGKALYSHSASLHLRTGYRWIVGETWQNCGGVTCNGLASRPGEVDILPAALCYRNQDKLQQLWARLGSKASLGGERHHESKVSCLQHNVPTQLELGLLALESSPLTMRLPCLSLKSGKEKRLVLKTDSVKTAQLPLLSSLKVLYSHILHQECGKLIPCQGHGIHLLLHCHKPPVMWQIQNGKRHYWCF